MTRFVRDVGMRRLRDLACTWPTPCTTDAKDLALSTTSTGVMRPGTTLTDAIRAWWYPPRPDDGEGWARWVRAGGPVPGVSRSAYGPSEGVDARRRRGRVRCLGNGVAPRQAAAAFLSLIARGAA